MYLVTPADEKYGVRLNVHVQNKPLDPFMLIEDMPVKTRAAFVNTNDLPRPGGEEEFASICLYVIEDWTAPGSSIL